MVSILGFGQDGLKSFDCGDGTIRDRSEVLRINPGSTRVQVAQEVAGLHEPRGLFHADDSAATQGNGGASPIRWSGTLFTCSLRLDKGAVAPSQWQDFSSCASVFAMTEVHSNGGALPVPSSWLWDEVMLMPYTDVHFWPNSIVALRDYEDNLKFVYGPWDMVGDTVRFRFGWRPSFYEMQINGDHMSGFRRFDEGDTSRVDTISLHRWIGGGCFPPSDFVLPSPTKPLPTPTE
jgi:hypothetical protein